MAWRHQNNQENEPNGHNGKHDNSRTEQRAADILRRLGAEHGSDSEVVERFMRRVDERAEDLKRDQLETGKRGWW
jgi:hypothetical protein